MKEDFSSLSSIFQMFAPADRANEQVRSTGKSGEETAASRILRTLIDRPGSSGATVATMKNELEQLLKKSSDLKKFHSSVRFFSTAGNISSDGFDWHLMHRNVDDPLESVKIGDNEFERIVSLDPFARSKSSKQVSVVCSDESFISPLTIAARDAETFMNFVPSYVASRCVPYLEADFAFDRPFTKGTNLVAPSLLKFLLGSKAKFAEGSADDLTSKSSTRKQAEGSEATTVAGMELFTSPQTLANPVPVPNGSRYVSVLDHFRPLASILSLNVEVRPTFGLMTYKTANLTLVVHDRSRLAELADLIKPLIYARTTVWLTYGWRHPVEPRNPYAEFINSRMLVREPYGIVNSSYEFDQVGQVKLNLQLYTRGTSELKDIRITDTKNSFKDLEKQIQKIADDIQSYRQRLKLDNASGVLKEVRAYQIIEAGSFGSFPNLDPSEVSKLVSKIDSTFLRDSTKIDREAVEGLKKSLQELYSVEGSKTKKFAFNERFNDRADSAVKKLFDEVRSGPDVFMMTPEKDAKRQQQLSVPSHPYASIEAKYNETIFRDPANRSSKHFRRLVSFGKLFSTFMTNAVATIDGIDQLQLFFYPFNESAGTAASVNIAEFPIDMSIFLDQFKDHVAARKTDRITMEEFLKLVIDAQLQDVRGPGYGFFSYFEPYDPKVTKPALKKGQSDNYENALAQRVDGMGPFKMPAIDVYVETVQVSSNANTNGDLLATFHRESVLQTSGQKDETFTKVMRIHVFDKTVDPYPLAGAVLRTDDRTGLPKHVKLNAKFQSIMENSLKQLDQESLLQTGQRLKADQRLGVQVADNEANETIKRLVSQTIPTILYGGNASTVSSIQIQSKQDPLLTSVQMLANKAGRPAVTQPNGGGTYGLPLRVVPAQITVNALGNPAVRYGQLWFLDAGTGCTIDNRCGITGLSHTISPGRFETSMTLSWFDAYGSYEASPTLLNFVKELKLPDE